MSQTAATVKEEPAGPGNLLSRLKRLGVTDWAQVLLCMPQSYLDYSKVSTLGEALPKEGVVSGQRLFSLVVSERPVILTQPKKRIVLTATDGMLSVKIAIFIVAGVDVQFWKTLAVGDRFHVLATLQNWAGRLQITSPALVSHDLIGRIVPRYPSRRGVVAQGALFDATRYALVHHLDAATRYLLDSFDGLAESAVMEQTGMIEPVSAVLAGMHQPDSMEKAESSHAQVKRLAAFSIVFNARRLKRRNAMPESVIQLNPTIVERLLARLPNRLTKDQLAVIDDIVADLQAPYPMRRVISGDVGTGKTFCYMIPALAAQIAGRRVAILTPNTLLVEQFVRECQEAFGQKVPVRAVTGGSKQQLDLEGNPILVGTTALLSRFRKIEEKPDWVIIDETQKLSVGQKSELADVMTNYLEATATPIPRTTALITHGALDVSIIRERPVERAIQTRIVHANEAKRLFDHTRKVIESGGQVAIVYPLVRKDTQELKSVTKAYARWAKEFPGRVGMVHGMMKENEKAEAINQLKQGVHAIGVVSSIIEIGLTLPHLKSVVVVHAERYGVSTLHQLRGRPARGGGTGYFFLYLPGPVSDDTLARMCLLEQVADGFELAERDAQMRGYGDLFEDAERQHGNSRSTVIVGAELRPEDLHQFAHKEGP